LVGFDVLSKETTLTLKCFIRMDEEMDCFGKLTKSRSIQLHENRDAQTDTTTGGSAGAR